MKRCARLGSPSFRQKNKTILVVAEATYVISVQKHQSKASFRDFPKQSVGKYPESPPLKQEIPALRCATAGMTAKNTLIIYKATTRIGKACFFWLYQCTVLSAIKYSSPTSPLLPAVSSRPQTAGAFVCASATAWVSSNAAVSTVAVSAGTAPPVDTVLLLVATLLKWLMFWFMCLMSNV